MIQGTTNPKCLYLMAWEKVYFPPELLSTFMTLKLYFGVVIFAEHFDWRDFNK